MKETITESLSTARRKLSQLAQGDPVRLDVEQVARELELEEEAKKLAQSALPAADQTTLSAPEARALQRVEKARRDCVQWASVRMNALNEDIERKDVTALVEAALVADRTFERQAAGTIAEHEHLLGELAENAASRERELDDFRVRHGLTRPATYPEGSATFARYAILLALIVVEGIANAYFFSMGLDSGLIGGFLAAGLFAAVNLVTAFVLGKFGVPFVFHRNPVLKAVGIAAAVFAVIAMITVGLTIAHFRDALMADAAQPARAAWSALQASPLGLHDLMSWLLFAISVLFAVFALFDGLSSDDRYPGYGDVARRARQSREDYLSELHAIRKALETFKDDAIDTIQSAVQKGRALAADSAQRLREKKWTRTQMEAAILDAEQCLDTLLKIFRDTNQLHRGTAARPAYFDTRPQLQQLAVPDFAEDDRAWTADQQRLVDELVAKAEGLRAAIDTAFHAHAERLKPADRKLWTATVRPLTLVKPETAAPELPTHAQK
ncbi:MAG TPA: hypothetical protein VED01_24145 [Burkholderiales bacterium]|nr:hypothetical protein [Burkholderiales bacterium]